MSILLSKVANPVEGETMKRLLALLVAGVVGFGVASAFAGEGCCAAGKAKADAKAGCGDMFSKLNLTDAQKSKVAELKKECDATKCTEASRAKFMAGLKGILTPEQMAQCEAECKKAGASSSCPMKKAEGTAEKKS
jgi:Spy/CpxP family protein refolding chaperone